MTIKTYSELTSLPTFEERFEYVKQNSDVGKETFGYDRYLNQKFYTSKEWRQFRSRMIVRDNGCDLAMNDGEHEIHDKLILHHLNSVTQEDILNRSPKLFDPENVVCVSDLTHRALTYSDIDLLPTNFVERKPNDTTPWRR